MGGEGSAGIGLRSVRLQGRRLNVEGEEGLFAAGVGGEWVTVGGESGVAADDGVLPVGTFVEVGAGIPSDQGWVAGRLRRGE